MMLASPLPAQPAFSSQRSSDDSLQYRPAKDLEAFNNLLPPAIEFIEGSSSGALAVPPGKYEPINGSPKLPKVERPETLKPPLSPTKATNPEASLKAKVLSLYPGGIDLTWPEGCNRAPGLFNTGNTCFLNSVLQCLLHTPPLLRILIAHRKDTCRAGSGFCMACNMRLVVIQAHGKKVAFSPTPITSKLQIIAKHMRRGRQEDSHEFLRYAIDALQKSCLAGYPSKMDPKLAETTWVHKIFGGQLRSRVTCHDCGHNSDTFDRILDLSVDIHKAESLREALRKFVAVDYLRGADKYKCEKCKKHVVAEKRFSLHDAPAVLTVHLKRFSPLGRKIGHHVQYEEHLSMQPYMSEGQFGPLYSLYGVICHAGGGPNSGHYFAYIKSKDGQWWEMNDESVTMLNSGPPVNKRTAYMLFYIRKKGQELEAAMGPKATSIPYQKPHLVSGMKKRKEREGEQREEGEDKGVQVSKPVISLPLAVNDGASQVKRQKSDSTDPQAALVKAKIEVAASAQARVALTSLGDYASDTEDEGERNNDQVKELTPPIETQPAPSSPPTLPPSSPPSVTTSSFYAESNPRKRKAFDAESEDARKADARKRIPIQSQSASEPKRRMVNPYNQLWRGPAKSRSRPRGL
ncbi:hypothetical protein BDZ94DRAFT_1255454 [Collybia nuda]|uniref:Ubiquitin carboxyl-terminal hydrolase n=1 Tax=Collybia nuda TaxID=64659 RepID=A0A9P5YAL8_9AGAR|nr:hypothetical protein BDZ94DRAFT_1255454 [Collybia nuda]